MQFKEYPDIEDPIDQRTFEIELGYWELDKDQSLLKRKLKDVFKQFPIDLNHCPKIRETWERIGPFDVSAHIDSDKLKPTTKNVVVR